ncbi:MAG: translation initiation factor IF-2 [Verrucomicrobiota bacterium]|nr:translation initiation factor IF-2 [Verrucomicrobiota bacterium]
MPVRIYDIARKLGIESKDVIAKAKELGITAAKVPSSSLDKITAEYLEEQFAGVKKQHEPIPSEPVAIITAPEPAAAVSVEPAPAAVVEVPVETKPVAPEPAQAVAEPVIEVEEAVVAKTAPPEPEVEKVVPVAVAPAPEVTVVPAAPAPASTPITPTLPPAPVPAPPAQPVPAPVAQAPAPVPPAAPAPPAGPQLGSKVGFIQLPPKPQPRTGDKVGSVKLPPRPGQPAQGAGGGRPPENRNQPQQQRFGNQQPQRGGGQNFQQRGGGGGQGNRPGFTQNRGDQRQPAAAPAEARFVPPSTGTLISLKPPIVVRDLAEQLKKKPFQLIADLMELNVFANVNQAIDEQTAQRLCAKYGFRFEVEKRERGAGVVHAPVRKVELDVDDKVEDLKPRAPVVTIMGHVDHGKTTLLDVIRKANVASGEAGGITQHIGAYTISIPHPERPKDLQQITFLDTPGHAAFSSMRARGANVTDIVILVVAANDGVMPQTLEALSHAQAAKVPIIVAVNKVDHPNANPVRVRQQLQEKGVVCEEWGGETIFQDVSALTKVGIDKLLELVVLQAEIMELKANPNRRAKGNVIESGLEPGGPTATVLVRKGTLRVGDVVICGSYYGRVRALISEDGARQKEAGPSVAVKLLGLNGVPEAGLEFSAVENEKAARALAEERDQHDKKQEAERRPKVTLENLFDTLAEESSKILKVVVKADTQGSVEAIVEALKKIETNNKVALDIIHSAVGTITESDVILASASKAIVLGFHTRIDNGVSDIAKREGVQIKLYAIIYELIDQVKEAMAGLLDPLLKDVVIGSAEVRKIFELSKGGSVAGCVVASGRIVKGKMRVMRRKGLIYEGVSQSLRRFQDEVNEVRAGMECGIRLDGFDDFQVGDSIECYTLEKVAQKL